MAVLVLKISSKSMAFLGKDYAVKLKPLKNNSIDGLI